MDFAQCTKSEKRKVSEPSWGHSQVKRSRRSYFKPESPCDSNLSDGTTICQHHDSLHESQAGGKSGQSHQAWRLDQTPEGCSSSSIRQVHSKCQIGHQYGEHDRGHQFCIHRMGNTVESSTISRHGSIASSFLLQKSGSGQMRAEAASRKLSTVRVQSGWALSSLTCQGKSPHHSQLWSYQIAARNASKFTSGEAPHNFRPETLPYSHEDILHCPRPADDMRQLETWPISAQVEACCKKEFSRGLPGHQSLAPNCRDHRFVPKYCSQFPEELGATRESSCQGLITRPWKVPSHVPCVRPSKPAQVCAQVLPAPVGIAMLRPAQPILTTIPALVKHWGFQLRLHTDTQNFAQHLYCRLPRKDICREGGWTVVLLLLGCLWIACKLEESRLGLPSSQHIANLVAPSLGSVINAAAVSAVEIQIMGLLSWQPLAGWDDVQYCKGIRMP